MDIKTPPPIPDDMSLDDIARLDKVEWVRWALTQWIAAAGEAVATAPAAAVKDVVETFGTTTCEGCNRKVGDWQGQVVSHDGVNFCSEECFYTFDPDLHRRWVKAVGE